MTEAVVRIHYQYLTLVVVSIQRKSMICNIAVDSVSLIRSGEVDCLRIGSYELLCI